MKKVVYILAFGFLGLLTATLIHGVVELIALDIIFSNPQNADSIWWQEWSLIHAFAGTTLWIVGVLAGLLAGTSWWEQYGSKPGAFRWGKHT